jgi:hypothetical protein
MSKSGKSVVPSSRKKSRPPPRPKARPQRKAKPKGPPPQNRGKVPQEMLAGLKAPIQALSGAIPSGKLHALIGAITLPQVFPPPRVPLGGTAAPTAVAKPFTIDQADWTIGSTDTGVIVPNGQMFVAMSRSPCTSTVRWELNPGNKPAVYQAIFYDKTTAANTATTDILVSPSELQIEMPYFIDANAGNLANSHPHGDTYFPVDVAGRKAFFLSATDAHGAALFVKSQPELDVPFNVVVCVYRLEGREFVRLDDFAFDTYTAAVNSLTILIHKSGYYSLSVRTIGPAVAAGTYAGTDATVSFNLQFAQLSDQFAIRPIPHFKDFNDIIASVRVNASALMMTPHPALLYLGGQVTGVQLPAPQDWIEIYERGDPFTYVNSLSTSKTFKLKSGIYGFHKPETLLEYEFTPTFVTKNEQIASVNNPIDFPGGWMVLAATVGLQDGSYPSGSCHLTFSYAVEFRTTNVWFDVESSPFRRNEMQTAIDMMEDITQWHENPFHIKDIMSSIASKGKSLLKIAPSLVKALSMFFPGAGMFGKVADALAAL